MSQIHTIKRSTWPLAHNLPYRSPPHLGRRLWFVSLFWLLIAPRDSAMTAFMIMCTRNCCNYTGLVCNALCFFFLGKPTENSGTEGACVPQADADGPSLKIRK
jgi:hypothetical protein